MLVCFDSFQFHFSSLGTCSVRPNVQSSCVCVCVCVRAFFPRLCSDHISGAPHLKSKYFPNAQICIGSCITQVQRTFNEIFNLTNVSGTGSEFDRLFADGAEFKVGSLTFQVMHTPGHTPACACYIVGDAIFTGDTIFHSTMGTARCDFPGGSAEQMYRSVQRILALPAETRIYWAHDYPGTNREFAWGTTVAEVKANNKHIKDGIDAKAYITMRETRDAQLNPPGLLYPSLQTNVRAGLLPDPESNGTRFLKTPIFPAEE